MAKNSITWIIRQVIDNKLRVLKSKMHSLRKQASTVVNISNATE